MVIGTSGSQYLYKDPIYFVLIIFVQGSESRVTSIQGSYQLAFYQNQMSYQNFTLIIISFSLPNDEKILE